MIRIIILLSVFLISLDMKVVLAEEKSSSKTVGIPDNGIGGPITENTIIDMLPPPDINFTSLHKAAKQCDIEKAQHVFNKKDLNTIDREGHTPLSYAAQYGCIKVVKFLVAKGAMIDKAEEHSQWTPLLQAADQHHADVVEYLLAHGADVNKKTVMGQTPTSLANANSSFQFGPKGNQELTIKIINKYLKKSKKLSVKSENKRSQAVNTQPVPSQIGAHSNVE